MIYFLVGFVAGAYVAQNYQIPDVHNLCKECLKNLNEYEKKNSK